MHLALDTPPRPSPSALPSLIIGMGKTGLSCARYLARLGEAFAVADTRAEPPGLADFVREFPDVPVYLGGAPRTALIRAERVIVSPGVALEHPTLAIARARGIELIGDVELFARQTSAPVAAITGANGKSTVTSLLGRMAAGAGLDVRVGGNLGTPCLELLGETEPDLYVLELSSFQLERTDSLRPAAATVLNLTPDHMDRYASLGAYAAAKARVFLGQGAMIINRDDAWVRAMAQPGRRVLSFGIDAPVMDHYGLLTEGEDVWLMRGRERLLAMAELRLAGLHNAANVLAALALGEALGLPRGAMLQAARDFPGLPHRMEWVGQRAGVRFYNDSKGTNVGATLAAVQGLAGPLVLIAGGDGKGADFAPLRSGLAGKARAVVLIGRDAPAFETALDGAVATVRACDLDQAVEIAAELAQPDAAVLLSPACASFDMFDDYQHRGAVFRAAVQRLIG